MMVQVEHVRKAYRRKVAVEDLSFEVREGELFIFLGPNGAGKTTTFKMLTGLLDPDRGAIRIGGHDIRTDYLAAKRIIGYIPDEPFLYEKLTGNEYLDFITAMFGYKPADLKSRRDSLTGRFEIADFADTLTENYSHGMKQRLIFTAAFLHDPKLVVIDEPMVGLDPYSIRVVKDLLREEVRRGTTVLMSTHTLSVAEELADRVLIIHRGRMECCDTVANIKQAHNRPFEDIFLSITGRSVREREPNGEGAVT